MSIPIATALLHVQKHTRGAEKFRNYAVSDFMNYRGWLHSDDPDKPDATTLDEFQKTWALYKKWAQLCKSNPLSWSSANGCAFNQPENSRKFRYRPGATWDDEPELLPRNTPLPGAGEHDVVLAGVGQCEYFAMQAYQALKKSGPKGTVPPVHKVATPGHNWVLVNFSPEDEVDDFPSLWIVVDYWLLALGVPRAGCICRPADAAINFTTLQIEIVESYLPK